MLCSACRNADTLKRLQETEKKLKEQQTKAYISMDISNEEREKGNQVCKSLICCRLTRIFRAFRFLWVSCVTAIGDHAWSAMLCLSCSCHLYPYACYDVGLVC